MRLERPREHRDEHHAIITDSGHPGDSRVRVFIRLEATSSALTWTFVVETMGLEPTTSCLQSRCSSQLSYVPRMRP